VGWAKAGVSLAVRFSPRRLSPSVSIASAPLRTSASTRAGSLRGGSTEEAGPGPPVDPDPFLDLMNSWSRFALRRCAEFGAARLRCCGALIGSSHWRLAGASLATLPLVSMARLSAPILKTTRTPWTSTEYASVLLPTLHARVTSRHTRSSSRPRRDEARLPPDWPLRLAADCPDDILSFLF
jgi:hypothetical protein